MRKFALATLFVVAGCATSDPSASLTRSPSANPNANPAAGGAPAMTQNQTDPYISLENSADPVTQKWVQTHNAESKQRLESDPRFKTLGDASRVIVTAQDRIPFPTQHGAMVRNFWTDQKHQRGLIRETTLKDYLTPNPTWTTVLDIDALNKAEGKSWVYGGSTCLPPNDDLCLLHLSDGGRDEAVIREFSMSKREFIKGGFEVPPAKTRANWLDKDTLILGTNWGPDSLTDSGYPRQVRIWKRGEPLANAKLIFEGQKTDVDVTGWKNFRTDSGLVYISQGVSFFEAKVSVWDGKKAVAIPFPSTADFQGDFAGQLMAQLRKDWSVNGHVYSAGTVLSIPLTQLGSATATKHIETVFAPNTKQAFQGFARTKHSLLLSALNNVRGEISQITRTNGKWISHPVKMPLNGTVSILDANDETDHVFVLYQTYNEPQTLYFGSGDLSKNALRKVKSLPAKFDASDIVFEQHFATSTDGTQVPYFLVHKKSMKLDGTNPTLLYAYGGFEVSETPTYSGVVGKIWLEKGGVYAVANIRGGGEFGPRWHEAALKENRQRAYDDFAAVAKDLISSNVTSPRRLGAQGGSNGGLLMGVAMTQHPELFNAIICESALLDMIRYTQMPPGASWIGEYGDPADPAVAAYISKFSPYQNIKTGVDYPEAFFHISTADDRVQPGHTRKMVARLEERGHKNLFYENTEGGHGGAADPEQSVHKIALEFTYLYQKLMD